MSDNTPIVIHKYPNRRFYDTVNSRHVTLEDIQDLVVSGKDVVVTDTRTGDDLTNVVLMQILLERDHLKLDLLPSSVIHLMIRSSRNTLRTALERFFGPFLGIMAATQKQFDAYLRDSLKGQAMSPLDWTKAFFPAFSAPSQGDSGVPPPAVAEPPVMAERGGELEDLREQIEQLRGKVMELNVAKTKRPRKKKPATKPGRRK